MGYKTMATPQVKPDWNTGIYIGNGVVATPKKVMPKNYTLNILLDAGAYVLDVNVDPNTCFDDRFKAWCNDENEMLLIDGWNVAIIEKD
jgi:hypothetical protein